MNQAQREEMIAAIGVDMLAIARSECALIWHADAKGELIYFRAETSPQAALGVRLVTQPRAVASSNGEHAYDIGIAR